MVISSCKCTKLEEEMTTTWEFEEEMTKLEEENLKVKQKKAKKDDAKPAKQELQVDDKKRRVSKTPTLATIDRHLLWHTYLERPVHEFYRQHHGEVRGKSRKNQH